MPTDAPCTDQEAAGSEPLTVIVRVEPLGVEIPVPRGSSLMRAAERQGLRWPTVCGGDAECGTCSVTVASADAGALPPPSAKETQTLRLIPPRPTQAGGDVVRLACQLRPTRGLVVWKRGVRPR